MKRLLESLNENLVLIFIPVYSTCFFQYVHVLIFEEPEIFAEEKIRETLPIVLIVEGLKSTEFNITH